MRCYHFKFFIVLIFHSVEPIGRQPKIQAEEPVALTAWSGSFSSPNFPSTYPGNSSLTWIKSVSSGNIIEITIYDLLTQCDGDYLEIRDGDSMASPLIARYCGNPGSGNVIRSSGSHMILHFVSDNVTNSSNRGFLLQHNGVCKIHTNATSGIIATPNYPNHYLNFMDCLWTIQLHPSILIILECAEFALEYKEGCGFDYMEILAGVSDSYPVLGRYCGVYNNSLTFQRYGNISIRFASDKDKELGGFRCVYSAQKVRGDWTEWTIWTECSQTCHLGNQTRYRTCVNPLPESGLELVCGDVADTEMKSCLISNCTPVDGDYTTWSNWSACNVACGTGFRNRSRSCTNPPPDFAGNNCSEIGAPWETTECVLNPCPGLTTIEDTQAIHAYSTLDTLKMLNNWHSTVEDKTVSPANNTNSKEDSSSWNAKQDYFTLSHSTTPQFVFTEPVLINSALPILNTGQHVLRTSRTHLHSASLISQKMSESYNSQTADAKGPSSLSVSVSLPQKNLSSLANSWISPNKTLNLTNLSQKDSLGTSKEATTSLHGSMRNTAYNSLHSIEDHNIWSFSTQVSVFSNPTSFSVTRTTPSASMTNSINDILTSISTVSEGWAATVELSKSRFGLHTTETVAAEEQRSTSLLTSSESTSLNSVLKTFLAFNNSTASHKSFVWPIQNNGTSQESFHWKNYPYETSSVESPIKNANNESGTLQESSDYHFQPTTPGYSSPLMIDTARNSLTLTRKTIQSSIKDNSQETNSRSVHSLATMHSNLLGKHSSSPTTSQNEVTTTSLGDTIRSTNHTTFSLATGMVISYSNVILLSTDGQNTGIRIRTTDDGFNTFRVQTLRSTATVSVSSTRDRTSSSSEGTKNSPRNYPSHEMYSSPTPNTISRTQVAALGSVKSHQRHTGSLSATVTRTTTVCCETRYAYWSAAAESGMHQTHEESTLQTESLKVRTVQQSTSAFHASADRIGGSDADGTELANNLQRQSPLSTFEITSALSRLSSTISPSKAAPSHPPGDSTSPSLKFPWHLIPFLVILFLIILVLLAYYLRIPGIINTIILSIKERRKRMKALKPENSFNLTQRNFSVASFETSTFHSYQRELFYDATLNYAMFEQSKTNAIEFSVHLDEEQQFSGPEESVEISCVMEEEPAYKKQGHGSLGEMFDTSGSDITTPSGGRTIMHDSPVCYDI